MVIVHPDFNHEHLVDALCNQSDPALIQKSTLNKHGIYREAHLLYGFPRGLSSGQ